MRYWGLLIMAWYKKIVFLFLCSFAILGCKESVIERRQMKAVKNMVARVKVKLMPVNDFGSWVRKMEAMEALS